MDPGDEIAALRRELERVRGILPERVDVDPEGLEQGLAKLVLTLVEFLRQLLERQAIRRMDGGTLTDDEIERVGLALMRIEQKVADLAGAFGLDPDDLNIGLGPIGKLL
ncbi:MAG: gas vesicle protein K [Actinobacteria bacterium]|nr:gas vesicle protein K [Actinomycetota bacterium]